LILPLSLYSGGCFRKSVGGIKISTPEEKFKYIARNLGVQFSTFPDCGP
jgi:hypothetical protein